MWMILNRACGRTSTRELAPPSSIDGSGGGRSRHSQRGRCSRSTTEMASVDRFKVLVIPYISGGYPHTVLLQILRKINQKLLCHRQTPFADALRDAPYLACLFPEARDDPDCRVSVRRLGRRVSAWRRESRPSPLNRALAEARAPSPRSASPRSNSAAAFPRRPGARLPALHRASARRGDRAVRESAATRLPPPFP